MRLPPACRALGELRIEGIRTTVPLFQALLADPDFTSGNMDIAMLDRKLADGELHPPAAPEGSNEDLPLIAAAIEHYDRAHRTASGVSGTPHLRSRWKTAARHEALRRG